MARCVARAGAGPGSVRTWRTRTRSPCSRRPSRPCPRSRGKAPTRPSGPDVGGCRQIRVRRGWASPLPHGVLRPPCPMPLRPGAAWFLSRPLSTPGRWRPGGHGGLASCPGLGGAVRGAEGVPVASSRSASLPSVGVSSAEQLLPCGPSRWGRWSRRALFWLRRAHGPSQADLIPLPRIEAEVDRRKGGWRGSPGSGRSPGGSERSQLPSPLSLALQGPRAPSAAHVLPATPRQLSSEAVWLRRVHARVCVGKGAPWRLPWACGAMARAVLQTGFELPPGPSSLRTPPAAQGASGSV